MTDLGVKSMTQVRELAVDVVEQGQCPRKGRTPCRIGSQLQISPEHLNEFCLHDWDPLVFDALVLAAAVEFCDRILLRSQTLLWGRCFRLRVPVHEPYRWNGVVGPLVEALEFLTGDSWHIDFRACRPSAMIGHQRRFNLEDGTDAVMPYSEGLDSRVVSELEEEQLGRRIVRVRVGSSKSTWSRKAEPSPFACVAFKVKPDRGHLETSSRSRGFKFCLLSGMAAYLKKAPRIIIPESGQGSLGPSLLPVGQVYEDYRNHPLFTQLMARFLKALCPEHSVRFCHPRLWHTKGETLLEYIQMGKRGWTDTRSCWRNQRHVSVDHKRRQCGVCAACMLRRLAVHAAGQVESSDNYAIQNLEASTLNKAAVPGFITKWDGTFGDYALAGTLHMDHLAALLESAAHFPMIHMRARQLARCEELSVEESNAKLRRLLRQHATEWKAFLDSLGPDSFVTKWTALNERT